MPKKQVTAADRDRGRRYKKAREDAGLTQSEVAGMVGKHVQTVSRWEQGVTRPHDEEFVARLYKRNPAWLEYGEGPSEGEDPPYSEWPKFSERAQAEPWQIAMLRTLRFPAGIQPELETYDRALFALRSVRIEPAGPPPKRGKST